MQFPSDLPSLASDAQVSSQVLGGSLSDNLPAGPSPSSDVDNVSSTDSSDDDDEDGTRLFFWF